MTKLQKCLEKNGFTFHVNKERFIILCGIIVRYKMQSTVCPCRVLLNGDSFIIRLFSSVIHLFARS